jgi:hypothetical protein
MLMAWKNANSDLPLLGFLQNLLSLGVTSPSLIYRLNNRGVLFLRVYAFAEQLLVHVNGCMAACCFSSWLQL